MRTALAASVLLWGLAGAARADLQLLVVDAAGERATGAVWSVGQAAVGDALVTRFRLRNPDAAAVTVRTLSVAGTGFRLGDAPALPRTVTREQPLDFTVVFTPPALGGYSAVLQAESVSTILSGTAVAAVSVLVSGERIPADATIDFGTVERGSQARRTIVVANQTPGPLVVPPLVVTGESFAAAGVLPAGQLLNPGASVAFDIVFQPLAAGTLAGSLQVGDRAFALRGMATEPPPVTLTLRIDLTSAQSAQQGRVTVSLGAPARAAADGTLTLDFQPLTAGATDAAILFASGTRQAAFTVASGETTASFGAQPFAAFQTGATAGTLVFTARWGDASAAQSVMIPAAGVGLTAASAGRTGAGIDVSVTGWDNVRTTGSAVYTFYDAQGNTVPPGVITADVAAAFAKYFAATDAGGAFLLKASFPVTGDAAQVAAVEVQVANSVAAARTARVKIP
jgi:hypothetical protein